MTAGVSLPVAMCFYGSLRPGADALDRLGISDGLRWIGPCSLRGALYDLGEYPGLVTGDGLIRGDLCEVRDARSLAIIDDWEDYFAHDLAGSLYIRRRTRLVSPDREALVYWYNRPLGNARRVTGNCWLGWRGVANG